MSDANGSALAVVEPSTINELSVSVLMRRATDVAGVCREIVTRTAQAIPGSDRKHVKVEGWESIAAAYGYAAGSGDVEPETRDGKLVGFKSKGFLRRLSDGVVIAEAEGFVGEDEPLWAGGGLNKKTGKPYDRRPEYARRAMAQTRAISRVCRGAFAFVVTLIDHKLSTTPAEEMDGVTVDGSIEPPPPVVRGNAAVRNALRPSPPQTAAAGVHNVLEQQRKFEPRPTTNDREEPPPHVDADFRQDAPSHDARTGEVRQPHIPTSPPTHDRTASFGFGRGKDVPLADLDEGSLKWYAQCLQRDLDDAGKARWHEKTRGQLRNLLAEQRYRGI